MKLVGTLLVVLGAVLLICGIAALFASASPYLVGFSIFLSVISNAAGITLLSFRRKK